MAQEFYQRVRQIFDEALERPETQRNAFVQTACAGDATLIQEVERLLRARVASQTFLETAPLHAAQIGRYLIRGELGRGAMGVVYDAVDPMIGRRVAVKVIRPADTDPSEAEFMRERLFKEARSAGRLFHPGIVIIFDVGQQEDSAFVTMERVDGPSLHQILTSGKALETSVALDILQQTAAALDYAHQQGVVHRDIKPANIMLHNNVTVKVTDFGIAKIMSTQNLTLTGVVMGTPSYMSPEQIEARPVDGRSDQFSLAVLAYELLTGARPFVADSIPTVAHMIVYGQRPSARSANPALPARIDEVLERALNRLPEQRFGSCVEFVKTLEAVFHSPQLATEAPPVQEPAKVEEPVKKRSAMPFVYLGGIALVVVALALAAVSYRSFYSRPRHVVRETAPPPVAKPVVPVVAPSSPVVEPAARVEPAAPLEQKPAPPTPVAAKPAIPASTRAQQFYNTAIARRRDGKIQEAVGLFREAAEMGEASAMEELAESYHTGEGVSHDDQEALRWFRRAADAGNSAAMVSMGALYLLGDIVTQSEEEAARWFQKAADRNNPAGMFDLATLYESGLGVSRNADKATQLYQRSAALGNIEAQRRLSQLQSQK